MCTAPNLSFCVGQVIHNRTKSTMLYIHKQQKYAVHPQMTESYCLFTNNSHAGHPQSCWPSTNRIMLAIHKQSYWPSTNNRIMLAIHSHAGHPQTVLLAIHKQSCWPSTNNRIMLLILKQQNYAGYPQTVMHAGHLQTTESCSASKQQPCSASKQQPIHKQQSYWSPTNRGMLPIHKQHNYMYEKV